MQWKPIFLTAMLLPLAACQMENVKPQEKTPLEIQAIQTQQFDTSKTVALASVISVFQDLGYIIKSADRDTGFVTAQSATQSSDAGSPQIRVGSISINLEDIVFDDNDHYSVSTSRHTLATAFIEELQPNLTTVRLNFVSSATSSSNRGQTRQHDRIIDDPGTYTNAFDRIGDAIFIRSAN